MDAAIESVVVTAGALPGTALDPDKVPFNTQIINSADLKRFGAASTLARHSSHANNALERYQRWRRQQWWQNEMGDKQSHFQAAETFRR